MSVSGSVRRLILNGVDFSVLGDTNISEMGGGFENEMVPTSGVSIRKMTKRAQTVENVVVGCDSNERELLKAMSEQSADIDMSYTTADGAVRVAVGTIEFATRETEENRATLMLLPRNGWTAFAA